MLVKTMNKQIEWMNDQLILQQTSKWAMMYACEAPSKSTPP